MTWLHYGTGPCDFKHIVCSDGSEAFASNDHLIMTGGAMSIELVSSLNAGLSLLSDSGHSVKVIDTAEVTKEGFAAPLTRCGNLFVDGVLFSCYAHMDPLKSRLLGLNLSPQTFGDIAFRPLILYRSLFPWKPPAKPTSDEYMSPYAESLIWLYEKMMEKNIIS